MTVRALALILALFASTAPVLAHGIEMMHGPHPQHAFSLSVERIPIVRRGQATART